MARTATTIANLALGKLGAATIPDINITDSREARACNRNYEHIRDLVTRRHRWACAIERQSIAKLSDEPIGDDYDYQYQLPVDPYCLRALDILGTSTSGLVISGNQIADKTETVTGFRIEGRKLLTNEISPINLRYIKRMTDPNEMDNGLVEAIATALAIQICYELTKSLTLKRVLEGEYLTIIDDAIMMNQIEAYGTDQDDQLYSDAERG